MQSSDEEDEDSGYASFGDSQLSVNGQSINQYG